MASLVVVESPAKAKTLARILGKGYQVEASYGHVRDLPESAEQIPARLKKQAWARLGVNVEQDFEPLYVIPSSKKKYIQRLKKALAQADELLLATDEDREGESISWHVVQILEPEVPVRRIVFHEITVEAIREALRRPRDLDANLVRAQESRRILDRLFGYELSPVLWRKVRRGLSAGRVQSAAVRLCVERERERRRFQSARFWDAEADFEKDGTRFTARLTRVGDRRVATGQDFDSATGALTRGSRALWIRDREEIDRLVAGWRVPWRVASVQTKAAVRRPEPPFTTSSLQQEANRKLRFSARHTMRVAQRLYEGIDLDGDRVGLITYMRTDSVTLAERALKETAEVVRRLFGAEFSLGPRRYKTKSKMAQEAHEAIRPTEIARDPSRVAKALRPDELRLYELIWKRTVASQMTDARLLRTAIEIEAPADDPAQQGQFSVTGTTIEFPGFLRVYSEDSSGQGGESPDTQTALPALADGDELDPLRLEPRSRDTKPPARYTEATLVKTLEAEGIGRPSTYAAVIDTIQQRGYVLKQKNAMVPTFTAFAVTELLENHFAELVDLRFTAKMEQQLDDIAAGRLDWKDHLRGFYFGEDAKGPGLEAQIASEEPKIDFPKIEIGRHPGTSAAIVVKVGRYGPYLQQEGDNGEKVVASLPDDLPPADLTVADAVDLLEKARRGAQMLGHHPDSHEPVYLAHGRYGAYVQMGENRDKSSQGEKPRRASVPSDVEESQVTLELALKWLSLPRDLGIDPSTGEQVVATSGRFGPFIKRGDESRSLEPDDDVYTIGLDRALELLAQPKKRRAKRRGSRKVLRDFGSGEDGSLQLLDGRYGPYLTNGELNASLPKGIDPASLDRAEAVRILAERGKKPRRRRRG